jgi:predicted  nucleic acid-binding Zn-ribbon protein
MRRREINIFSISFLDLLSGALAAVLILFIFVPKLDAKLIEEIKEFKKLEVEVEEVKGMINQLEDSVAKDLYEQLKAKLDEMEATIASLKQNVEDLRQERKRLDEELGQCREELEALKEQVEQLQGEVEALEEENQSLQTALEAAEDRANNAERSLALTKKLDIVFVLDCTSSMEDEIADLKANLTGTIRVLQKTVESIYIGFVAFRDVTDDFVTKKFELTNVEGSGLDNLMSFVNQLEADGGGDTEEAVYAAMNVAENMSWRSNVKQVMVLLGDAPAHSDEVESCYTIATNFKARPTKSKVSTVYASQTNNYIDFFQEIARKGGGDFVKDKGRMMESILISIMD